MAVCPRCNRFMLTEMPCRCKGAPTDDEIVEWSVFMGYPVSPMEIATLKVQLRGLLDREGSDKKPGPWRRLGVQD